MRFGLMQSKAGLATIVYKYNVILSPKTEEPLTFSKKTMMLTCENGIFIRLQKRSN